MQLFLNKKRDYHKFDIQKRLDKRLLRFLPQLVLAKKKDECKKIFFNYRMN